MIPAINKIGKESPINERGIEKFFNIPFEEVLRHPRSGHIAIRIRSNRNNGELIVLKNGGPTEIFTPFTASEIRGKIVPQKTAKQIPKKIMLLYKKELSLERNDSILGFFSFSFSYLVHIR